MLTFMDFKVRLPHSAGTVLERGGARCLTHTKILMTIRSQTTVIFNEAVIYLDHCSFHLSPLRGGIHRILSFGFPARGESPLPSPEAQYVSFH